MLLPAEPRLSIRFTARSDVGRRRGDNEDRLMVDPEEGWALLADGMGGHRAGEFAATMAVEIVAASLQGWQGLDDDDARRAALEQGVLRAHRAISARAFDDPDCDGMGTTLVVLAFTVDAVFLTHLGDSRAYLLRNRHLRRLTRDHSVTQRWLDEGLISADAARHSRYRGMLTQALGQGEISRPEVTRLPRLADDVYLVCSDGLTDMLGDPVLEAQLLRLARDPEALADRLIEMANAAGGRDNISLVLATPRR